MKHRQLEDDEFREGEIWGKHVDKGPGVTHHAHDDCAPSNNEPTKNVATPDVTDKKKPELSLGIPMGYSNWESHGKKYGYLNFATQQAVVEVLESVQEEVVSTHSTSPIGREIYGLLAVAIARAKQAGNHE